MTKFLLGIFCALIVVAPTHAESVAGRTIKYKNSEGQTYWTTYKADGTTFTKSTTLNGKSFIYDSGKWRMEGEAICEMYNNWRGGKEYCHGINESHTAQGKTRQASTTSAPTCSGQNSICTKFCKDNPQRGEGCRSDCAERQKSCLITGTYLWKNSPNVVGLLKR